MFDAASRSRLRWALGEGLVIAGIVAAWVAVAVLLGLAVGVLRAALGALGLLGVDLLQPVYRILLRFDLLGRVIVTRVAAANVALYVLVRTGTVVVDRYHDGDQ